MRRFGQANETLKPSAWDYRVFQTQAAHEPTSHSLPSRVLEVYSRKQLSTGLIIEQPRH
jgi:hypothetical protein